jgi:hypothetical protein
MNHNDQNQACFFGPRWPVWFACRYRRPAAAASTWEAARGPLLRGRGFNDTGGWERASRGLRLHPVAREFRGYTRSRVVAGGRRLVLLGRYWQPSLSLTRSLDIEQAFMGTIDLLPTCGSFLGKFAAILENEYAQMVKEVETVGRDHSAPCDQTDVATEDAVGPSSRWRVSVSESSLRPHLCGVLNADSQPQYDLNVARQFLRERRVAHLQWGSGGPS